MTLQWIPLDRLVPHPENSNRMPPRLLEKLKGHIQRTGLYEPLVVRPLGGDCRLQIEDCRMDGQEAAPASPRSAVSCNLQSAIANLQSSTARARYQILNGHHRAQALRELGHTHARCDVWAVDDAEARLLLATLNRLEGRDDPSARAALVARLADGRSPEDLARLLPEPPDAVERLLKLAAPPPAPIDPASLEPLPRPMTFFLTEEQHALVSEALQECGARSAECGVNGENEKGQRDQGTEAQREGQGEAPLPSIPHSAFRIPHCLSRAERLERLALWYLEARNLR